MESVAHELKSPETIRDTVSTYMDDVLSGSVGAGKLERLAVARHMQDLDDGHERGLWFDEDEAIRKIQFFGLLKHSKGEWAGQPLDLFPWQMFVKWCLFGWKRKDGTSIGEGAS